MFPKPRYLDLQQELCSAITLHKELIFDNKQDGLHLELFEKVTYISNQRMIDLTETIVKVVRKTYGLDYQCQIHVYDPFVLDFRLLAYFPQENNILLGQQFLQADTLLFEIKHIYEALNSSDQSEQEMAINNYDLHQQQPQAAGPQQKTKRRKTVKEMLQVVEQWRKFNVQSDCKISLEQAADILGLKRRTLQFYIHCAKVGEKNGYKFQLNLDKKICDVGRFLKEKTQDKKHKEMEMLQNFKLLYK